MKLMIDCPLRDCEYKAEKLPDMYSHLQEGHGISELYAAHVRMKRERDGLAKTVNLTYEQFAEEQAISWDVEDPKQAVMLDRMYKAESEAGVFAAEIDRFTHEFDNSSGTQFCEECGLHRLVRVHRTVRYLRGQMAADALSQLGQELGI